MKVGDRVRIKKEYNAGSGGYTYTKINSEGIIQSFNFNSTHAFIKFYKYTGIQPSMLNPSMNNNVWEIILEDIELIPKMHTHKMSKEKKAYRRIVL